MKLFPILILISLFSCTSFNSNEKKVLVFHKTSGYKHESIPEGIKAIKSLGKENGYFVKETKNAEIFEKDGLYEFDLIIFLNTSGDVLNKNQQDAFEKYIEGGGNFFGIHAASDTELDWDWYGKLVGAYFVDHPEIQPAKIVVEDKSHPAVAHLPEVWERTDEWYNFRNISPSNKVLLKLDEDSYRGGTNGENHPVSWYQELIEGGISIYTGLGHTKESYNEPAFVEHINRLILFALSERAKGK